MKPKQIIILGSLVLGLMFFWAACTNLLEWRGGEFPKLVWGKSGPDVEKLKQQREHT